MWLFSDVNFQSHHSRKFDFFTFSFIATKPENESLINGPFVRRNCEFKANTCSALLAWNWNFPPLKAYAKQLELWKMMGIRRGLRVRNANCHGWIMAGRETIRILICFFYCFTFPFFRSPSILGHHSQEKVSFHSEN